MNYSNLKGSLAKYVKIVMVGGKRKMPLPRPCDIDRNGCGKRFQPQTSKSKLCEDCKRKNRREGQRRKNVKGIPRYCNRPIKVENLTYKPSKLKHSPKNVKPLFCSVCGVSCPDKLKVEVRKGTYYPSCTCCFALDPKEFKRRARIKHL